MAAATMCPTTARCYPAPRTREFPSMARLREWYASPEYAEALAISQTALARRLLFVEGAVPA